jgi:hypothetical protein
MGEIVEWEEFLDKVIEGVALELDRVIEIELYRGIKEEVIRGGELL